jgi:hypothetical protein
MSCLGVGTSGREEDVGRGCKNCVHMCVNGNMRHVETIPGKRAGG